MRRAIIIIIIVVVLGGLVAIRLATSGKGSEGEKELKVIPVEVTEAVRADVASTCEVLGMINANKTAPVLPETMGRITKIFVKEGAYVSKGSRLMALRNETIGFEYEENYITAPINGNVSNIMVDVGAMVTPQQAVAMVVEYSYVEVAFNVSENAMECIKKGNKIIVEVDALPDQSFPGAVTELSPVIDPMTRTIAARAAINNPKKTLKPGMTARVILTLGSKENVISIPRDALLDSYLFVVKDSITERRDVEVGLIGDKRVEILAGVSENEQVVVVGQQRLAGGEKVNPVKQGRFTDNTPDAGSE
jgi:membrane fusion protein (multidrug efflux system)